MTLPNPELNPKIEPAGNVESSTSGFVNNRQYVRVYYPQNCPKTFLPELTIHYRTYQLLDISETGLRFHVPRTNLLHDDILTGAIRFTDDSIIEFSGVVVRRLQNQIALKLIIGIPYSYIASEQVRLRNLEAEGAISFVNK